MTNHSLRVKIINRNKEVTSLRDYAVTWNFRLSHYPSFARAFGHIDSPLGATHTYVW